MAGRVSALAANVVHGGAPAYADVLTPALVDRAVDMTLANEDDDEVRAAMMHIWAEDSASDVAQMLQAAVLAQNTRQKFAAAGRQKVTVRHALNEEEVRILVDNHQDADITFSYSASHDHGLANAERKMGSAKVIGNIPTGMKYADFGGSVTDHIEAADLNCVSVVKTLDNHDPMRAVYTRRRLEQLSANQEPGRTALVARMARSVLMEEGQFHVSQSLQEFNQPMLAGVMVHVYDVPITEIPKMMERCGMLLFEGTVHFSSRFFFEDEGELPGVGGRFAIDRESDTFKMGFVGSPVLWYEHKWSEFRRYGADQVMHGKEKRYSYKIVERTGDTIFFRVLQTGGSALPETRQFYEMPKVAMVEVQGSQLDTRPGARKGDLVKVVKRFPQASWEMMVRSAAVDATKGVLDYHRHIASYMTLTATNRYNGINPSGGRVAMDDVPALVVWSAVYAVGELILLKRGIKTIVELEMARRDLMGMSNLALAITTFLDAIKFGAQGPLTSAFSGLMSKLGATTMADTLVRVRPVAKYVQIPVDLLESNLPGAPNVMRSAFPMSEHLARRADFDDMINTIQNRISEQETAEKSQGVTRLDGDVVQKPSAKQSSAGSVSGASTTLAGDEGPPEWMPVNPEWEEYKPGTKMHTADDHRQSVVEEIELCREESDKLEAFFAARYSQVVVNGELHKDALRRKSAEWKDADMWYISEGVVLDSALGRKSQDFDYGGLFVPKPVRVRGPDGTEMPTHMRPVLESTWSGVDPVTRLQVDRVHWQLDGEDNFTGWAMSNREMSVFNGRQIVAGLQVALKCSFEYETGVYMAGPGAGKTTLIHGQTKPGDFTTSPLAKSVKDLRKAFIEKKKYTPSKARTVARTLDSLLVLVGRSGRIPVGFPRADLVRCDEIYNARLGRAHACFALLGANKVIGFGDPHQIAPVVRADREAVYKVYRPQHIVERFVVFRGTPQILACFNHFYDNKLRTLNKDTGQVVKLKTTVGLSPTGDCVLLCMNQAVKKVIQQLYPKFANRIHTTHEYQGAEADNVYLFCMDTFKRPLDDMFHLYNVPEYVNVAISRARRTFTYVNFSPNKDCVEQWIELGRSPVAISLAADMDSIPCKHS